MKHFGTSSSTTDGPRRKKDVWNSIYIRHHPIRTSIPSQSVEVRRGVSLPTRTSLTWHYITMHWNYVSLDSMKYGTFVSDHDSVHVYLKYPPIVYFFAA
mmetsp:Transcript_37951/g.68347  ORF Transcript_37951/g.68347 Transcript_37951/m.68347 type:complete len:99 (-) Transcript_37951:636-932(-)